MRVPQQQKQCVCRSNRSNASAAAAERVPQQQRKTLMDWKGFVFSRQYIAFSFVALFQCC
jgi:hypothetical protein